MRLLSLNIEQSKHLDLVLPFLQKEMPDVACLQEVCESDIETIAGALSGAQYVYAPLHIYAPAGPTPVLCVCLFSRLPIRENRLRYYRGSADVLPRMNPLDPTRGREKNGVLLGADVGNSDQSFRILTTHFTWTPNGQADDFQREDMRALLGMLAEEKEFVFAGDLNAPRMSEGKSGEIFSMLTEHYKDNIPLEYETSLDATFHRAGYLPYMVDGLFSTPEYIVSGVRLVPGVSDHRAIIASVSKVSH